jgi:RimJ/RimL family protein N-acetyltransferase
VPFSDDARCNIRGRFTAEVLAGNEASVRMLKRDGFTEAGRLHCHRKTDGDLMGLLYLGLLRAGLDTPP